MTEINGIIIEELMGSWDKFHLSMIFLSLFKVNLVPVCVDDPQDHWCHWGSLRGEKAGKCMSISEQHKPHQVGVQKKLLSFSETDQSAISIGNRWKAWQDMPQWYPIREHNTTFSQAPGQVALKWLEKVEKGSNNHFTVMDFVSVLQISFMSISVSSWANNRFLSHELLKHNSSCHSSKNWSIFFYLSHFGVAPWNHFSAMNLHLQFKSKCKMIMLLFNSWPSDHYNLWHMPPRLCCGVMCQIW